MVKAIYFNAILEFCSLYKKEKSIICFNTILGIPYNSHKVKTGGYILNECKRALYNTCLKSNPLTYKRDIKVKTGIIIKFKSSLHNIEKSMYNNKTFMQDFCSREKPCFDKGFIGRGIYRYWFNRDIERGNL